MKKRKFHVVQNFGSEKRPDYQNLMEIWAFDKEDAIERYLLQYSDVKNICCEEIVKGNLNPFNVQLMCEDWT